MRTKIKYYYIIIILLTAMCQAATVFAAGDLEGARRKLDMMKKARAAKEAEERSGREVIYDPREKITLIAVTGECVKKLKKFPTRAMMRDVCDYLLRCRAAAVGLEFLYDVPQADDQGFVELVERSPRLVLATENELDPNRFYKDWDEAGNDFKIVKPYLAFDRACLKKGYVNFDAMGGFKNLRYHSFLMRNSEIFPSLPVALVLTAENIERADVTLYKDPAVSKYGLKFSNYEIPKRFVLDYKYNFAYTPFHKIYAEAAAYLKNPVPETLPFKKYEGRIVVVGDMSQNAKVYIKNMQNIFNLDLIANSILAIYESEVTPGANR